MFARRSHVYTRQHYTMKFLSRYCLLAILVAVLSMSRCKLIPDPPVYNPSDCGYTLQEVPFSDPTACAPQFLTFTQLNTGGSAAGVGLPPLPDDCTTVGRTQVAYLNGIDDESFFLHVYKGAPGPIALSVYGEVSCGEVVPLLECQAITAVASRFEVKTAGETFSAFFVRFTVDADPVQDPLTYDAANFIRLAAYEDKEPASAGGIHYSTRAFGPPVDPKIERDLPILPFDCSGTAFQRIVLSACEEDGEVLKQWIKELGVTPSEAYFGEKGNVVVFDVPPGMDLNTTGGSAQAIKAKLNTGDGTAEPDYIVNLFNPRAPATIAPPSERIPLATTDPLILDVVPGRNKYFITVLPPFRAPEESDLTPVQLVTIIDSGVDPGEPNQSLFKRYTYRQPRETEFVKPNELGFDFVAKDFAPNDLTPHGTHVAGAVLGQYAAKAGLNLVHMKTFGEEGISSYFGALVSLYEANAIGSDVINMSWGISNSTAPQALTCAVKAAVAENILLVTSAGNDTLDLDAAPQWPAAFSIAYPDNVIATASYWYRGKAENEDPASVELMYFSNFGKGTVPLAAYMTTPVPAFGTGQIIFPLGTSFSAPIVTGQLVNFFADNPGTSLQEFRAKFYREAASLSGLIRDKHYLPIRPPSK